MMLLNCTFLLSLCVNFGVHGCLANKKKISCKKSDVDVAYFNLHVRTEISTSKRFQTV